MTDEVLTIDEAAELVKLSKPLLLRALKSKDLLGGLAPAAGGYRITKRTLLDWVDAGMPGLVEAGGETDEQRRRRLAASMEKAREAKDKVTP